MSLGLFFSVDFLFTTASATVQTGEADLDLGSTLESVSLSPVHILSHNPVFLRLCAEAAQHAYQQQSATVYVQLDQLIVQKQNAMLSSGEAGTCFLQK